MSSTRRIRAAAIAAIAASASACAGSIEGSPPDRAAGDPPTAAAPGAGPPPRPGSPGASPAPPPIAPSAAGASSSSGIDCAGPPDPGPVPLRPLARAEHHRAVLDLTGFDLQAAGLLPPEGVSAGFETIRDNFVLSSLHLAAFMEGAEAAARFVTAAADRRAKVIGCEPTGAAAADCLRRFAAAFGRRAFRRPLAPDEASGLAAVAQAARDDPDPYMGAALVMRAALQSPKFLLRVEVGTPDPSSPRRRRLTGPERAARLSFTLLGTTPDEALLASAEAGGLDDPREVEAAARRLLGDPRARAQLRSFFAQWLGLARLRSIDRDRRAYPQWNDALRASMQAETVRLVEDFAWTEGRAFIDVLDARHTFVDAALARLYGVAAPAGASGLHSVRLDGTPRVGLLTHASLLTVSADGDVTPIRRGKLIQETLLCRTPPEPPVGVPDLAEPRPNQSARERLEEHRRNPACSACHALLDPVGFGLARFDDIGAYRPADAAGRPISDEGELLGVASPRFRGPAELAAKLRETRAFPACVVEKLMEFSLGRARTDADPCLARPIEEAFARGGYGLGAAILAMVRSDAFLYRRTPETDVPEGGRP
jgi:hypothetical protein